MKPSNAGAVFQVASQFNCLEMVGPGSRPEDGVTIYSKDHTQGKPVILMSRPVESPVLSCALSRRLLLQLPIIDTLYTPCSVPVCNESSEMRSLDVDVPGVRIHRSSLRHGMRCRDGVPQLLLRCDW